MRLVLKNFSGNNLLIKLNAIKKYINHILLAINYNYYYYRKYNTYNVRKIPIYASI